MGQPPAVCNTRQYFDDAPALQQVMREAAGASAVGYGRLEQRLCLVERRIDASNRLMQEVHALVREMRQDRQPAVSQSASSTLPVLSPGVSDIVPPAAIASCSAPWPSQNLILPGNTQDSLPRATRDLVASASGVTHHSWVTDAVKAQIWSGEYVNMASLLTEPSPPGYNVTVSPGQDNASPMFCLAPRQKTGVLSFGQWLQAFEIDQSVLLLQPSNLPDAGVLLMYIDTIRKMYERGSDWRSYDQAFRTLRRETTGLGIQCACSCGRMCRGQAMLLLLVDARWQQFGES